MCSAIVDGEKILLTEIFSRLQASGSTGIDPRHHRMWKFFLKFLKDLPTQANYGIFILKQNLPEQTIFSLAFARYKDNLEEYLAYKTALFKKRGYEVEIVPI